MAEPYQTPWRDFQSQLIARAWKDEAFKQELLRNPKAVLQRELGREVPDNLNVKVMEQPANTLYIVLPTSPSPKTGGELTDEDLESLAGGAPEPLKCRVQTTYTKV